MTDVKRAQNVCQACLLRKKACDKALPACAFCASRRLQCRYDASASKSKRRRIHNPGRHFVALHSPSPEIPGINPQAESVIRQLPSPESQQDPTAIYPSSIYLFSQSTNDSLTQQLQHFAKLSNLTCDDIIDRYFQSFHKWLPVVSPDAFRREASRYRGEGCLPPADFTVLLLAMLQIILPALDPSLRPPRATQELLYTTTKSALSQAQTPICTSLRLVQGALLIALREYTCVRPEAAYISLMTCAGLARVEGIGTTSVRSGGDAKETCDPTGEGEEERENVAWAIAMLERLILCEMDQRDRLQPQTDFPGTHTQPLSDPNPRADFESTPLRPNQQAPNQISPSSQDATDASRQAQSLILLGRLLSAMRLPISPPSTKLASLAQLDSQIRTFLATIMAELDSKQTPNCVPIALCVRQLFLLHTSVLATLPLPKEDDDDHNNQTRLIAHSALAMACRMETDVAHWRGQDNEPVPMCAYYNLRAARGWMQECLQRLRGGGDEGDGDGEEIQRREIARDIERFMRAEEGYRERWVF